MIHDHLRAPPPIAPVIELDDYRPVWRVARERCKECDNTSICVVHVEAPLDALQCSHCEHMTAVVTHWEVSGDPDETEWEPRIVEDLSGCVVAIRH